jgi:hypothetical protein
VQPDVHALLAQLGDRVRLQFGVERTQHRAQSLDQDDPRLPGVDAAVVAGQHLVRQLGHLAGQLHAGGSGADHHEGQPLGALRGVLAQLRHLERGQDVAAQVAGVLDGLHAGRELGPLVPAEIGMGGTCGDHQRVVRQVHRAVIRRGRHHRPAVQVETAHVGEERARVRLLLDHAPDGGRDQARRQDARGDLVEQGLEQVMVGAVDQGDVDVRAGQRSGGAQSAESPTDHHDAVPLGAHATEANGPVTVLRPSLPSSGTTPVAVSGAPLTVVRW